MRHANKKKRIGRNASHRKATLQSLSTALITHKRIETTLAKAKALRPFVEPIIHRAQDSSTASRRQAFRKLQDKEAVKTLFGEIAEAVDGRPGGYTRIVKLGQRGGDAAEMAVIELVDFNNVKPEGTGGTKRKTRRSRRSGSAGAAAAAPAKETPEAASGETKETPDAPETAPAPEALEQQEAEAVASDSANPDTTGNPQVPTDASAEHGDSEQGAAAGTGEPPPEAQAENQGRSADHR